MKKWKGERYRERGVVKFGGWKEWKKEEDNVKYQRETEKVA